MPARNVPEGTVLLYFHAMTTYVHQFKKSFNHLKPEIHLNYIHKNAVPTSQKAYCISVTNANSLMFRKIITVYCGAYKCTMW
jgi:hypothetical protein